MNPAWEMSNGQHDAGVSISGVEQPLLGGLSPAETVEPMNEAESKQELTTVPQIDAPVFNAEPCDSAACLAEEDPPSFVTSMKVLLKRLEEVEEQMQSASFTIGFLQSELDGCKAQMRSLPDYQRVSNWADELERQNNELRQRLPELELNARRLADIERENMELRLQLEEYRRCESQRSTGLRALLSPQFWKGLIRRI